MTQSISGGRCGRRILRGFFLLFAAVLAAVPAIFAPAAFAQKKPISVLITASRFAETADGALAPVTVITREDIDELQLETVEEVLKTVPGVMITQHGGSGQLASLFLRGAESNHVLFMIDGVTVANATNNLPPFRLLSLDQIEKIEVVRGPRSSLYGPQAIGGVIQIFTKRGGEERATAKVAVGSHKTAQTAMDMSGGGNGPFWYRLGASASSTQGFNVCRPSPPTVFLGCGLREETQDDDRDGHNNRAISFNTGIKTGRASLEANVMNSDNEVEFDGQSSDFSADSVYHSRVKGDVRIAPFWNSSLLIGEAAELTKNFKGDRLDSEFDTIREQASWQNDLTIGERHRFIFGADQTNDRVDSSTDYGVSKIDNTGVFASWRVDAGFFDAEASIRNDDNQAFGDYATGGIAWGANLGNANRVVISYGTGYAPPTLNDLYWPISPFFRGNPDLNPETSETVDIGFSGSNLGVDWSLNAFRTQTDNLIVLGNRFFADVNREVLSVINVDVAVSRGVELAANMAFWGWNFNANLTAQEPKATVGANAGKRLARRPKTLFNFDATRDFGAFALGVSAHGQSSTFNEAGNINRVSGYGVVDIRGELRLLRNWTLSLRVNNIFDKQYETIAYYPQDGTNYLLTLRHAFGAR